MKHAKQSGQVLVQSVVILAVLMGFSALAIDLGVLRYKKRVQQTAADAAAIAGASNLCVNLTGELTACNASQGYGGITDAAKAAAAANGFTDVSGGTKCTSTPPSEGCVTVTVNNPPLSGPHTGDDKYVEALVSAVHSTYFMKVVGFNTSPVAARAVATNYGGGSGCLYTLGTHGSGIQGIDINGNVKINAPSCGVVDNGDLDINGKSFTINVASFGVAGDTGGTTGSIAQNCTGNGQLCCVDGPCPAPMTPAADPLASYLTPPTVGTTPIAFDWHAPVPGATYNGISIPANKEVTFPAGIYIVTGGNNFLIPANSTVKGNGVTFYFTGGSTLCVKGTPTIQLKAPTCDPYAGILFYQDPTAATGNCADNPNGPSIGGNASSYYEGAMYFPKDELAFHGNPNTNVCPEGTCSGSTASCLASSASCSAYTMIVASKLLATGGGNSSLTLGSNRCAVNPSNVKSAVLVE